MLAYIIIAGLLFCAAMLFIGWCDNYDDDVPVTLMVLVCSLLWPVAVSCAAFYVAGKNLLAVGRALRCRWEQGRGP